MLHELSALNQAECQNSHLSPVTSMPKKTSCVPQKHGFDNTVASTTHSHAMALANSQHEADSQFAAGRSRGSYLIATGDRT